MKSQHAVALKMPQEQALFDQLGREVHERHDMQLRLARTLRIHRGGIQHRDQRAVRIMDGSRGARHADVAGAEVLVPMHDDRPVLGDARAHAIGTLAKFAPVGAQPQTGGAERTQDGRIHLFIKDDASRIGEQQRTPRHGDVIVQPVDFRRRHLDQVFMTPAKFLQRFIIEDERFLIVRGVEGIIDHAAAPGGADGRTHR